MMYEKGKTEEFEIIEKNNFFKTLRYRNKILHRYLDDAIVKQFCNILRFLFHIS